jgi:hypothetical protein
MMTNGFEGPGVRVKRRGSNCTYYCTVRVLLCWLKRNAHMYGVRTRSS